MLNMNKRDEKKIMLVMMIKLNIIFHNISAKNILSCLFLVDNISMFIQCNSYFEIKRFLVFVFWRFLCVCVCVFFLFFVFVYVQTPTHFLAYHGKLLICMLQPIYSFKNDFLFATNYWAISKTKIHNNGDQRIKQFRCLYL